MLRNSDDREEHSMPLLPTLFFFLYYWQRTNESAREGGSRERRLVAAVLTATTDLRPQPSAPPARPGQEQHDNGVRVTDKSRPCATCEQHSSEWKLGRSGART
jgi:hypothetical protein